MGDEPGGSLQFRMLGPLEAWRGETPLRLGGVRQRALLAVLLVHANELVRTERLVYDLLGEEPSESALNTTRVAVSRLRRVLENGNAGEVLLTRAGGYVLNAGPEQLDVARFERLLSEGRGLLGVGDAASAAARLREALALWRGPALADLAVLEFVQPEIRRLEELRLLALMERIDADLLLGADAEVIPELEGLVASNPLRERLRAQLMLALYRAGRQAEALEVYREVSELLRGELGLGPSRGLQELERRLLRQDPALELAAGAVTTAASATEERAVCPYKGLASFDRSDAEYFCGRERIVSDLVARLAESTLVGVVGPSGIGKSSLLRAGLLSALSAGTLPGSANWRQVLLRPGERPCSELARALRGQELDEVLSGLRPGDRLVVAVDQLEELFTVCEREGERVAFLDQLAAAALDSERRVLIVVALRADFYGRCATYTRFAELLSSNHMLVGPMRREELARAIELPATRAGLHVERALVDDLVADVASEPGGLPLLSTMLLELWRVRDGRVLRLERYAASGGVRGAVARLAENAYLRLDEPGRRVARGLLLRLAHGENGALVRRRLPIAELERIDGALPVLAALTDARLLTANDGEIEVSHEALLQQWPRYRAWLEEDRVGRRLHAHLADASRTWDTGGQDPGDLYRGARLTAALDWSTHHHDQLSPIEQEFVAASRSAAGRATRKLRAVLAGVAILLIISLIAGVIALVQKHHATNEARAALAQQLGAQAVIQPRIDLAMLLAREAVNLDRSPQTEGSLLATLQRAPAVIGTLGLPITGQPQQLAVSPDGRTLAVGAADLLRVAPVLAGYQSPNANASEEAGDLHLYDLRTHQQEGNALRDFGGALAPVYSDDGSLLAYPASGTPPSLLVRDTQTLRLVHRLRLDPLQLASSIPDLVHGRILIAPDGHTLYCTYLDFSPDFSSFRGTVLARWSLPSGRLESTTRIDTRPVLTIGTMDAGTRIAVVDTRTVSVFDAHSLRRVDRVWIRPALVAPSAAAMSPGGGTVAIASGLGTVTFIDTATGTARRGVGPNIGAVAGLAYSPDGRAVASITNGAATIWEPESATVREVLKAPGGELEGATFTHDGHALYTWSVAGLVLKWDLSGSGGFGRGFTLGSRSSCCGPLAPPAPPLAISPDGTTFASRVGNATVGLFSMRTLRERASFKIGRRGAVVTTLAWSPDAPELAVGGSGGLVQLWRADGTPHMVRALDGLQPALGEPEAIQTIRFSPDGRLVAASDSSETIGGITGYFSGNPQTVTTQYPNDRLSSVAIWHAGTGRLNVQPVDLGVGPAPFDPLAFSPDGRFVAVGAPDGSVRLIAAANGRTLQTLHAAGDGFTESLAFARGGTLATGAVSGIVQLWAPSSGRQVAGPLPVSAGPVSSIAFDPSGQRFVTAASQDGAIKLFATSTLQQQGAALSAGQRGPTTASFTSDGSGLLAVNEYGAGFVWPMSPGAWERRACLLAGRNLTQQEWARYLPGQGYKPVCP